MSVQRRATKGGTRYDVRLRDPGGRTYTRTFRTRREAETFQSRELADRSRGAWVDPRRGGITVEELATQWLAADPGKRATTRATDDVVVRVHILPVLGTRRIDSLGPPDVQRLVNVWSRHAAPRTVRRRYGVLRAMFAYAATAEWIGRSPCRNIKLPSATAPRRRALGPEEVARLAEAVPDAYRPMVWLGAVLGLRWSEVAGLRVGRLDLLRGTVTVAETVTRDACGRPVLGPPKSTAGARTLSIPRSLGDVLSRHLARRELAAVEEERLVFESPEGGPLRYTNWRRRVWEPATAAAGCAGAGFHDLRRCAATALVIGGVDVRTAQTRLGHSDARTTLAIYAQATEEADRRAAETVGEHFLGHSGPGERSTDDSEGGEGS